MLDCLMLLGVFGIIYFPLTLWQENREYRDRKEREREMMRRLLATMGRRP